MPKAKPEKPVDNRVPITEYEPVLVSMDWSGCRALGVWTEKEEKEFGWFLSLNPLMGLGVYDLKPLDLRLLSKTGVWDTPNHEAPPFLRFREMVSMGVHPLMKGTVSDLVSFLKDISNKNSTYTSISLYEDPQVERLTLCDFKGTDLSHPERKSVVERIRKMAKGLNDDNLYYKLSSATSQQATRSYLEVPKPKNREKLLTSAMAHWKSDNGWIIDPPTLLEFEDNKEMLKRVEEHLSCVPGLIITYLRKRRVAYFSDGNFNLTPDAINRKRDNLSIRLDGTKIVVHKEPKTIHERPCIFFGEAWVIKFTIDGIDYLSEGQGHGRAVFVTPEQFINAYKEFRPGLLKGFKPWSDFIFICSSLCERNGTKNYNKGIDLSSPHKRRLSLANWILGPLAGRAQDIGKPFKSIIVNSGRANSDRLASIIRSKRLQEPSLKEYEKACSDILSGMEATELEEAKSTLLDALTK